MNARQSGFTLIELVMVIVILGVLSATAIPRFINLQGDAQAAATDGIAGALGSASAVNYASRQLSTTNGSVAISDCSDVANALEGGLHADYSITAASVSVTGTTTCTVTGPGSNTATFIAHGAT